MVMATSLDTEAGNRGWFWILPYYLSAVKPGSLDTAPPDNAVSLNSAAGSLNPTGCVILTLLRRRSNVIVEKD